MARVDAARSVAIALLASGCGAGGQGSIGAVLGRDNETRALHVREAPASGAAEVAGLAVGDEIVMIDGSYVKDLGADEIKKRLRGEAGTTVALTVVRGDDVRHVVIKRAPMGERRPPAPRETRIAE